MDEDSGKRMIGRYCLFRPLASGGTATVYLGCLRSELAGFSRAVGIKKLHAHHARDARLVDALLVEARIASRIRHPNVVSVLDVVAEEGEQLVVLEYVHGESLSQILLEAASDPATIGVALRIVIDALEGLHAAHEATNEQGVPLLVVHRDVSPQNIMVDVDGRARIVDFGIAKALERPFTTTNTGEFRGKLAYAAPEQLTGMGVDRRTDIWATGMVLWELLAGRRFFTDAEPGQIVWRITSQEFPPPSSINPACPPALDALVLRALDRNADMRFSNAREMALALEKSGRVADNREVGRWVRKHASVRLAERSQMIAEMEAELRREPTRREPTTIQGVVTAVQDARRAVGEGSESTLRHPPTPAPSRRRRWWPVAAAVGLVTVFGAAGLVRRAGHRAPSATLVAATQEPAPIAPPAVPVSTIPSAPAADVPSAQPTLAKAPKRGRGKPRLLGARPTVSGAEPSRPPSSDPLGMDERN